MLGDGFNRHCLLFRRASFRQDPAFMRETSVPDVQGLWKHRVAPGRTQVKRRGEHD